MKDNNQEQRSQNQESLHESNQNGGGMGNPLNE